MTAMSIRKLRLVNFHNFVDETIELPRGGHLFLLGDNGSGKTTALDALHYALSGGELELNAAARVGGRRDEGRSIQGVVLRLDPERGVGRQGGAVAYAAVEAVSDDGRRVVSFGIGTEATTLEARPQKWGFVVNRPLDEVPLVDDAHCVASRDDLRGRLGAAAVFGHMTGYQRELGRRVFGSETDHASACRFWLMAKAYREIVAGARDFAALFERLLPEPDPEVFGAILRGLREVDELEVKLAELDAQRHYVDGLSNLTQEIAEARSAIARYRWLAALRERDDAERARHDADSDAERHRRAGEELTGELAAARARLDRAAAGLRRAESDDVGGIAAGLRDGQARRAELGGESDAIAARMASLRHLHDEAELRLAGRRATLEAARATAAEQLEAAAAAAGELPGQATALLLLAAELGGGRPPDASMAERLAAAEREATDALVRRRVEAEQAAADRDALVAQVETVETEATPEVAGWSEARDLLTAAGIVARPLYARLEPAPDAPAHLLAAIEALAGDELLGAFAVPAAQLDDARRRCASAAPAARFIIGVAPEATLPAWIDALLLCRDDDAAAAHRTLAAGLSQPASLGEVGAPSSDLAVALRTVGFRAGRAEPRLLGATARRTEQRRRLEALRTRVLDANQRATTAAAAAVRQAGIVDALRWFGGPVLTAAQASVATATAELGVYPAQLDEVQRRQASLTERLEGVDSELEVLRARAGGQDLRQLEREMARVRDSHERAQASHDALLMQKGGYDAGRAAAEREAERHRGRAAGFADELALATAALRPLLDSALASGSEDAIAHHVRVTMRGDSFRSTEAVRQKIADAERAAMVASSELEGDGSRGIYFLRFAAQFGFTYDRLTNRIEDRRGQPGVGVATELARTIAEQREVVGERTRALMDQLVMGELVRHLQGHVEGLTVTIREINRRLADLRFGSTRYRFQISPRADRRELVELVRRVSVLDDASRAEFRAWVDERLDELRTTGDRTPELLDYRRWFDFKLKMDTVGGDGVELTRELRQLGSGGEQGVPNYLLVLALAGLLFDRSGASLRPLMFDEAFYGIDAGRRDQLLRFATDLGLQLFVASPDQDGVTQAVRAATTLFVVKDEHHDVHLAPYHYWNAALDPQPALFGTPAADPAGATCVVE